MTAEQRQEQRRAVLLLHELLRPHTMPAVCLGSGRMDLSRKLHAFLHALLMETGSQDGFAVLSAAKMSSGSCIVQWRVGIAVCFFGGLAVRRGFLELGGSIPTDYGTESTMAFAQPTDLADYFPWMQEELLDLGICVSVF